MSNVTLSIGGRQFTVACDGGEEAHVSALGRMIDEKVQSMGDMSSQGESRMFLFASLLLADELHESRQADTSASKGHGSSEASGQLAERLERVAEDMENLASRLEG